MPRTALRGVLAAPVAAAALLSLAVVVIALLAARTLGERDEAVRAGVLASLAHRLEWSLREAGPDAVAATLAAFCREHADAVAGAEIGGPAGIVAQCGEPTGRRPHEAPLALGRDWRLLAGRQGFGAGSGPGTGHAGAGLRLRLFPAAALGKAGALAWVVVIGAALAAAALLALAVVAQRGIVERQRLATAEAEQRRLEAVALAGAGLAHRVRNPLAAVKGTAQLLALHVPSEQRARAERIVEASERIEALLARLLEFARPPEVHAEAVDVGALLREVAARTGEGVAVTVRGAARAWADREHVESIVEELIANARAFDTAGAIEVDAWRGGDAVTIEVRDRGAGLAVDPERAFDPYVTTRPEGTGLGLAIVAALAHANAGAIALENRPGGGCVARLVLPAVGE